MHEGSWGKVFVVNVRRGKYFNRINRLASLATFLTTVMLAVLCFSSFVSASESGKHTNWVVGFVKSLIGQDQGVEITSISLSRSNLNNHKYNYIGDTCQLTVKHSPSSAEAGTYTFSSDKPEVATVDQNGLVTFVGKGTAKITAVLKSDNSIKKTLSLSSYGVLPTDDTVVSLKVADFKVGQTSDILLNGGETSASAAKYEVSDPSVLYLSGNKVWAERAGKCFIKAIFEDGSEAAKEVTVATNAKLVVPTDYNVVEDLTFASGEKLSYKKLLLSTVPSNANKLVIVTSANEGVVKISGENLVFGDAGRADVTFTSAVNPSLKKTFTVTVEKTVPTALTIDMASSVVVNSKVALKASHDPVAYSDDVEWTVVKGRAIITDDGKLMTYFFGDVTIGARSKLNPTLYVEKTIKVKLYSSFYMFVRKILGHFSLFAVLGFGIFATSILLSKPHRFGVLLCPGLGFLCAAFCELCQSFVPGRYFAISDIFVNFSGTVMGMIICAILFAAIALIWRLVNKKSFKELLSAFKDVSIYTVFFKRKEDPSSSLGEATSTTPAAK